MIDRFGRKLFENDPDATTGSSDFDESHDDPDDCFSESFEEMFGPVIQEAFDAITGEEIPIKHAYTMEEMAKRSLSLDEAKAMEKDELIPIKPPKTDEVYFGSPTNHMPEIDLTRPLFVSPYKGIASIFIWGDMGLQDRIPGGSYNHNYEEWINFDEKKMNNPLKEVHVYVEGAPFLEPFTVEQEGYIHCISTKDYLNNFFRKPWMCKDLEYLIAKTDNMKVEFTRSIKCKVKYYINGRPSPKGKSYGPSKSGVLKYIHKIAKSIHAKYKADQKEPTGNQNCLLCAWCAEASIRGGEYLPRPVYSPRDPALEIVPGDIVGDVTKRNPENFYDMLEHLRGDSIKQPFARWYCHVKWGHGNGGHEFLIVKIDEDAFNIMDPQQGIVRPLTADDSYMNNVDWEETYICRIDDKPFKYMKLDKINDPNKTLPWDPKKDIPYMLENGMLSDEDIRHLREEKGMLLDEEINESKVERINDKGDEVPEKCDKCGSHIGLYLKGEPVWLCSNKKCSKYFGTAPCNFQEAVTDNKNKMIPVTNFKFNKVYYGDPIKRTNHMTCDDDRPLFVTPYPGLASIFSGRYNIIKILREKGCRRYNLDYDEWGLYLSELKEPLSEVHVRVEGCPDLESFTCTFEGYIHTIDVSNIKHNLYQYPWMSDGREVLITNMKDIPIEKVEKVKVTYIVSGAESRNTFQEGVLNDLKNGVNPYSTKRVFHVSREGHLDGQVFKPRVPEYLDKYDPNYPNFEDVDNPRVCFSPSIEGCLNAMVVNVERWKADRFDKLYVYVPEKPIDQYKHTTNKQIIKDKKVYDANLTREVWIEEPVRLKMYGVIKVDQISDVKKKSTVPMLSGDKGERNYYSYKWHWLIKPKVLDKVPYDYSPTAVCEDMVRDLKRYNYGIPVNGKVKNIPSSEYFDKHYRLLSPDEFEKYGGGICWDYVEFMEGYLDAYGYSCKKYYISTDTKDGDTHTFITVDDGNGGLLYPESSFKLLEGLHKVKNIEEAIKMITSKMFEMNGNSKKYEEIKYYVWEYSGHPPYGSDCKKCTEYFSKGEPFHEGVVKNNKHVKEGYVMSTERTIENYKNLFMEAEEPSDENLDKEIDQNDEEQLVGDLDSFGSDIDGTSPNNDYDQEEINVLNELIASESSAIGEYLDAAKNTNVDILRRLYSDIGDEERFHSEQLMFAKATLTGEKYEPRDPDVKREYEELLALGMDEETAMTTAIDKNNVMGTQVDDEELNDLEETVATIESAMLQCSASIDLMEFICESNTFDSEKLDRSMEIFSESFMYMEDANDPVRMKEANPLKTIWNGYLSFLKLLKKLLQKFSIFINKIRIKNKQNREWIKQHGIKGLFASGIHLYFYSDKNLNNMSTTPIQYSHLLMCLTADIAELMKINGQARPAEQYPGFQPIQYRNIDDGITIANNVVLTKTKLIVNDKNEKLLMDKFFGTEGYKVTSIYDDYENMSKYLDLFSKDCGQVLQAMEKLVNDSNSIYYTDKNLYNKGVSYMNDINKCFKRFANAIAHDMKVIMGLNKKIVEQQKNNNNKVEVMDQQQKSKQVNGTNQNTNW